MRTVEDNESRVWIFFHFRINIPGNKIDEGKELRYLPPMPWKGSGFHRLCFVLFEQDRVITDDILKMTDINR